MFERTAIEPTALSSYDRLAAARAWFGFDQGRLLAELPHAWIELVYAQVSQWPDGLEKAAARELLARLRTQSLIQCTSPYDDSEDWVSNAQAAKANGKVEHVAASVSHRGVPDLTTYFGTLEHEHTDVITHDVVGFERICRRPLEWSPRAVIVDPYFDPTAPKYESMLRVLVKWASGGKCRLLEVYAKHRHLAAGHGEFGQLRERCRKSFQGFTQGTRVTLVFAALDDRRSKVKMHRRMLLTSLVGLAVDYGFELDPRRESEATVLARKTYARMASLYLDGRHGHPETLRVVSPDR